MFIYVSKNKKQKKENKNTILQLYGCLLSRSSWVSSFLLVKYRLRLRLPIMAYKGLLDRKLSHINKGSLDKSGQMGIGVHWCISFSPSDGH